MNDGVWFSQEDLDDLDRHAEETHQLAEEMRANIRDAWSLIEVLEFMIHGTVPFQRRLSQSDWIDSWRDHAAALLGEEDDDDN